MGVFGHKWESCTAGFIYLYQDFCVRFTLRDVSGLVLVVLHPEALDTIVPAPAPGHVHRAGRDVAVKDHDHGW